MVAFVLFCRLYYNLFVLISFYRCWAPSPLLFSWFPCDVVIGSLFDFLGTGVNCDKLYLAAAFAASHRSRYVRILIELAQANRFSFLISSLIQGYLRVSCIIALFDFFFFFQISGLFPCGFLKKILGTILSFQNPLRLVFVVYPQCMVENIPRTDKKNVYSVVTGWIFLKAYLVPVAHGAT